MFHVIVDIVIIFGIVIYVVNLLYMMQNLLVALTVLIFFVNIVLQKTIYIDDLYKEDMCGKCFDKKEEDHGKKKNFCSLCGGKIGVIR